MRQGGKEENAKKNDAHSARGMDSALSEKQTGPGIIPSGKK